MRTAKEISILLAQRAQEVAIYLLPNGKKIGNEWCVGNIRGDKGESLCVHLTGDKAGVWCDFSEPNNKGDLLDLWCAVRNISLRNAIKEAANYLGISMPSFEGYQKKTYNKPSMSAAKPLSEKSPVMSYLIDERKLTPETIQKFKIGQEEREIVFPYYRDGEVILIKYLGLDRANGKKKIRISPNCEPCLFGWHLIPPNSRIVTICEGEIDAMTLHQYGYSALSVPFGGGGGSKQDWIEHDFERLAIFDEIYLCFDDDIVGKEAVSELLRRLGVHRCRIVKLPKKDANECLQAGVSKNDIDQCFKDAVAQDPEELKSAHLFVEDVIDAFYPTDDQTPGYKAPWVKTREHILFRPEELSVWTGINGHGKSQFLGHIVLSQMSQGARVCIASLEMKPKRLLHRLTRQAAAKKEPAVDYIRDIHEWYRDKLWLFDLVGTAKSERLLEVFLYARQRYGIDVFVIDSLLRLDIAEDDYNAQKSFIEKLCDFKNQYNCHVHIIVHPRKGLDESKSPGKLDCKGTGAITDLADNVFAIWRNKEKEKLIQCKLDGKRISPEQQDKLKESDCIWICEKQRNGDWEGKFGFWFDSESLQYLAGPDHLPVGLINNTYNSFDQNKERST